MCSSISESLTRNGLALVSLILTDSSALIAQSLFDNGILEALKRCVLSTQLEIQMVTGEISHQILERASSSSKHTKDWVSSDYADFLIEALATSNLELISLTIKCLKACMNHVCFHPSMTKSLQLLVESIVMCAQQEHWETTVSVLSFD